MTLNKYIVLDRDGVINEDLWGYVTSPDEFKFIDNSLDAIKLLNSCGYKITIATNQACINKGIISEKELNLVHDFMTEKVRAHGGDIEYIAFCPHAPEERCSCRKPEVGLLQKTEEELSLSLEGSFFVGDKESDMECAKNFGCRPLLVKTGYGEISLDSSTLPEVEGVFENLFEAAKYIEQIT